MKLIQTQGYRLLTTGVCAPNGFLASGIHCGLRKNKSKKDLSLIYSPVRCNAAAVYTQNQVKGASIAVTKRHLADGMAQAIIINSGNANTCNDDGEIKAQMMCDLTAEALQISADDVLVASTGVIGQTLNLAPIARNIDQLVMALCDTGNDDAAEGILTLDTCKKEMAIEFTIGEHTCRIGGMAKGSGMVHPNMATILCFITTDIAITSTLLHKALSDVVADTFNMISIDGDTSTNDTCAILSSGMAKNTLIQQENSEAYRLFVQALRVVLTNLSRAVARDGEGATKLLECNVSGAIDIQNAKRLAKSVITSTLFKCAMFGEDANWGRILCAIGYSQANFNLEKIEIYLCSQAGTVMVCKDGKGVAFDEQQALQILKQPEIQIVIHLQDGDKSAVAWGCDLSYEYVKRNGDYRK